jgi:hypothetical protein
VEIAPADLAYVLAEEMSISFEDFTNIHLIKLFPDITSAAMSLG